MTSFVSIAIYKSIIVLFLANAIAEGFWTNNIICSGEFLVNFVCCTLIAVTITFSPVYPSPNYCGTPNNKALPSEYSPKYNREKSLLVFSGDPNFNSEPNLISEPSFKV